VNAPPSPPGSRARTERRRLVLTLGDPRGIGPEVVSSALRHTRPRDPDTIWIVIGPTGTGVELLADEFIPIGTWSPGADRAAAGHLAGRAIEEAVRRALTGEVDAIVTAPIDKAALHAGGYAWPGHTEMLAALSGTADVSMLMCAEKTHLGGPLRIVLATTHVPLATVPALLTPGLLIRQAKILIDALRTGWEIERPRIAFCALNPHASDGGLFGDEEERVYGPALAALAAEGFDVGGPIPADTVFLRAAKGEFDAIVAPYHDVGMAAFKTAAFGHGVNVTLGLPFIRTSPDHGTALDIAGRGIADSTSMIEAIGLAQRLAARRGIALRT
jgi:4-hydroxythreonine-4-phosphate dehydrogenase